MHAYERLRSTPSEEQASRPVGLMRGGDRAGSVPVSSPPGQALLAHELAYVVQHATESGGSTPTKTDALEREGQHAGPAALRTVAAGSTPKDASLLDQDVTSNRDKTEQARRGLAGMQPPDAGERAEDAGVKAPASLPTIRIGGADPPSKPHRIVHVSWTLDDGPTSATPGMKTVMAGTPTTWFIMRNQLGAGTRLTANLAKLAAMQAKGDEIAIHSAHPTAAHVSWFPVRVSKYVRLAYPNVQALITDLEAFTTLLRQHGIRPGFVRMPGGEVTEVSEYLRAQGVMGEKTRSVLARRILKQESVAGESAGVQKVVADYNAILAALTTLGLKLWGGSGSGPMISYQSWQAESSGSGLTDDVTSTFTTIVDEFASISGERSLIILAHDTNKANAKEVQKDIREMEAYAAAHGVQIRYHSLSGLFTQVRGEASR